MGVVFGPFGKTPCAQKVTVVGQQFFETGPSHIGQLDLHFLGSAGGHAALDDVLFAGTRRLNHLIHRAVALVEQVGTKLHGGVIDNLGLLESQKVLVSAMGRNELLGHAACAPRKETQATEGTSV